MLQIPFEALWRKLGPPLLLAGAGGDRVRWQLSQDGKPFLSLSDAIEGVGEVETNDRWLIRGSDAEDLDCLATIFEGTGEVVMFLEKQELTPKTI